MAKAKKTETAVVPAQVPMQVSFDKQLQTVQEAMLKRADAEKESRKLREELLETLNRHGINMRGVAITDSNLQEILERIEVRVKKKPLPKNFPHTNGGYNIYSDACGVLDWFGPNAPTILGVKAVNALNAIRDNYQDPDVDTVATEKLRTEFTEKFHRFTYCIAEYEAQKTIIQDAKEFVGYVKDVASIAAASK